MYTAVLYKNTIELSSLIQILSKIVIDTGGVCVIEFNKSIQRTEEIEHVLHSRNNQKYMFSYVFGYGFFRMSCNRKARKNA